MIKRKVPTSTSALEIPNNATSNYDDLVAGLKTAHAIVHVSFPVAHMAEFIDLLEDFTQGALCSDTGKVIEEYYWAE